MNLVVQFKEESVEDEVTYNTGWVLTTLTMTVIRYKEGTMKNVICTLLIMAMVTGFSIPIMAQDDSPASWAVEEVEKAISEMLVPEAMQNNYTQSITREEFCILAIRMIEGKKGMSIDAYLSKVGKTIAPTSTFVDCTTKEVLAAKALGITDGTSLTTFDPDILLTREQAAKFLTTTAMACGNEVMLSTPSYEDMGEIATWAKPYTGYVYDINVMKGVGGNHFNPKGSYQRQQAFMTMYRLWSAIEAEIEVSGSGPDLQATIEEIKSDMNYKPYEHDYKAVFLGTDTRDGITSALEYEVYHKNSDIRVDTYYDDRLASTNIFKPLAYMTYTAMYMSANYEQFINGYHLPFIMLDQGSFAEMRQDSTEEDFETFYTSYGEDDEVVLYIKISLEGDGYAETWYSLDTKLPIKHYKYWLQGDDYRIKEWTMTLLDEFEPLDQMTFHVPEGINE